MTTGSVHTNFLPWTIHVRVQGLVLTAGHFLFRQTQTQTHTVIETYKVADAKTQLLLLPTHRLLPAWVKLTFHDADTDTDTDILADILARIVARMSACRSACHSRNFRKSRVSDVSARILARTSLSLSASWNASVIADAHTHKRRSP